MTETLHRYPGAQPFRDDEFSRRTFFGREPASIALTDQILANRLVIVYAKSGLGKTSLLNAGVAPRLRDAGSLPLFVRVNDIDHGPLPSVLEGIRAEAERQGVEYVPGDSSSLWSFFKTVEFWRGDLLLTPVLIIDQFEELFTLQPEAAREKFLSELSYIVRGVPPPSQLRLESKGDEAPPAIRLVLSLREDFLGLLEEGSDHIPEIMDHRYRLAPLSYEMASEAITGPAAIEHGKIQTRAFRLEPSLVSSILHYLTRSTTGAHAKQNVEPFHLQLICQLIERVAALKQQSSTGEVVLSFKDLGGEAALADTLESFYSDAIRSLRGRHLRNAARILCEQYLISPEGRRLSIEGRELRLQLKLPPEILNDLVERRLLRTDRRSDSTYYELSHDALVQPVLEGRRVQALVVGGAAILAGGTSLFVAVTFCLFLIYGVMNEKEHNSGTFWAVALFGGFAIFLGFQGKKWLQAGLRRRKRYSRHTAKDLDRSLPTLLPLRDRIQGWSMIGAGSLLFVPWGLAGLLGLFLFMVLMFTHGSVPSWLGMMKADLHPAWQLMYGHTFMELQWWAVEYFAIAALGWFLFRQGAKRLWPHRFAASLSASPVTGIIQWSPLIRITIKEFGGGLVLIAAVLGSLALRACGPNWHGNNPNWINWAFVSYRFTDVCRMTYQQKWGWNEVTFGLFVFSLFAFSTILIGSGFLETGRAVRSHRLFMSKEEQQRFIFAAVSSVVLIAGALSLVTHSLSVRERRREASLQQAKATFSSHDKGPRPWGWAVGDYSEILHTEDGSIWKEQNHGARGAFNSVTFPTSQIGWAAGTGGSIWRTQDSGVTWNDQPSGVHQSLSVIAAVGPRFGWAVGNGPALHTVDGGQTWKVQISTKDDPTDSVGAASFVTSELGWVVGAGGTILRTDDGGASWKKQESGTTEYLTFVTFATPQSGWAVGHNGVIVHTDDGGSVWKPQASGTVRDLLGIAFITPSSGWIVGRTGTILHTDDEGMNWRLQTSSTRADLAEAAFITAESGWAVGGDGTILHTDNGGETWVQQPSGTRSDLHSVTFLKPYSVIGVVEDLPKPAAAGAKPPISGALILNVDANGPAGHAGLKAGDIIRAIDGKPVRTYYESVAEISVLEPGTNFQLTYLRNGREATTTVTTADGSNPGR